MYIIDDGQYSFWATTNKAMPLHTTLPALFPSRGFASVHSLRNSQQWQAKLIVILITMGGSSGGIGEVPVTYVKQHKRCKMSSRASFSNPYVASPTSQLILQTFQCFTYVTAHSTPLASPTSQAFHLRHLASPHG